jgi:hypothetical protein
VGTTSVVGTTVEVYAYDIGIGPFAFESMTGEYQCTVKHLKKLLPAERSELQLLGHGVGVRGLLRELCAHKQEEYFL